MLRLVDDGNYFFSYVKLLRVLKDDLIELIYKKQPNYVTRKQHKLGKSNSTIVDHPSLYLAKYLLKLSILKALFL